MLLLHLLAICLCLPLLVLSAEDLYKLLGLDKKASDRDIKKAYRTLSKKYHPDKNPGNEEASKKFLDISSAYEALSNAETRKIYDQYGHEGLKRHKDSGGRGQARDPFDLFSRFFGGGGHFGGGERRGPNMEVTISLPLKDFYNGIETEFAIEKQMICDVCQGSGSKDGQRETCATCGGRGAVLQKAQLAPGIFQQIQTQCPKCAGQGSTIKHPCKACGGSRVVRQRETFKLDVDRGMPKGQRLQYENEADESPDHIAGDLIIILSELEPARWQEPSQRTDGTFFRRRGPDLFWREVLSLREAWMGGWARNLTHLDGHTVRLGRPRGQVVQPGAVETVAGEGMPIWQGDVNTRAAPEHWGALHVEYVVILPDEMEASMAGDFWRTWEKHAGARVDLEKDAGRVAAQVHGLRDEL